MGLGHVLGFVARVTRKTVLYKRNILRRRKKWVVSFQVPNGAQNPRPSYIKIENK